MKLPGSISRRRVAVAVAFLLATTTAAVFAAGLLETLDQEVSAIYEKSKDAIVKVHAEIQFRVGNLSFVPLHRIGTGFFVDKDGHLLTSATVVDGAERCWIDWRGQRIGARIIGRDLQTNLALLKINPGTNVATPFLPQGNSDDLHAGSMVIAIGFPYDMSSAPVMGFIGGLDIQRGGRVFATSHIRAACRLSPGQSGGPLLNARGEVIGIAVAAHMEDQCYALPINAARKVYTDILQYGRPQYAWVGLGITERHRVSPETGEEDSRVLVQQVYSNAPAAHAGFCEGDVLVRVGTNEVRSSADVLNTMFYCHAGDKMEFTVLRDGQEHKIALVAGTRPPEELAVARPLSSPELPQRQPPGLTIVPAVHEP
ncbi:MAG TPA: trypsin-like peptidase domain-containing protein [Verrucomicrobiae bacterium]|nr:trypsin-like peptidase domain-containing protein [Verrucomicrobiae bacterium]